MPPLDWFGYISLVRHGNARADVWANVERRLELKQAAEFGIANSGQLLATLLLENKDVLSIGQEACQGLALPSSFYWNLSPENRA